MLNIKYKELWRKRKTLLTCYSEVHTVAQEEFLPASVFCSWVWRTLYMETGSILIISNAFSILNVRSWVTGRDAAVWIVITVIWFVTICFPTMEWTTQKNHVYAFVINHMELSKVTTCIAFPKRTYDVVSLSTSSLDSVFSRNVWQVMFTPNFVTLPTSPSRESFSTNTTTHTECPTS